MAKLKKKRAKKPDKDINLFRQQHSGGLQAENVPVPGGAGTFRRFRMKMECRLDQYLIENIITPEQHKTGMLYRAACLALQGRKSVDAWLRERVDGQAAGGFERDNLNDVWARQFMAAVAECFRQAPGQYRVLQVVCWNDGYAGWPNGTPLLRRGLDRLAAFLQKRKGISYDTH